MSFVTYNYSVRKDFGNKINSDQLLDEIKKNNDMVSAYIVIVDGDNVAIKFSITLNAAEKAKLDEIIAAHVPIVEEYLVKIKEETVPTSGFFEVNVINITVPAKTTTTNSISWPFPVSALAFDFGTTVGQENDIINITIGDNTEIGTLRDTNTVPADWIRGKRYRQNDIVNYEHPVFGERVYTCIRDVDMDVTPVDNLYWQHGYMLDVDTDVTDNTAPGNTVQITDGSNTENCGRVIYNDIRKSKIYVEKAPRNKYSPASTILQTIYVLRDYKVGMLNNHLIGANKIGGSYIAPDTIVSIQYSNASPTKTVNITGAVQFLH